MAFEFKLPDIGEGVHEGEISRWLVQAGETVREDQPMVEVMTDKVTVEITSPVAGTVSSLLYKEGDTVRVGSIIITIEDGVTASAPAKAAKEAAPVAVAAATKPQEVNGHSKPAPVSSVAVAPMPSCQPNVTSGKVLAAPAARKLARSMGIDLAVVTGSGPNGRIRKRDVLSAGSGSAAGSAVASAVSSAPQVAPLAVPTFMASGETKRVPYSGMRRKIGDHLVKSKTTAPHFTYVEEADMTELHRIRETLAPTAETQGVKLTYLPFIVKAVIEGLKRYPKLNSTLDEAAGEIIMKGDYHIGVAVAIDDGLIVPVVKNAGQKSILEIAADISSLSQKARQNKLALDDIQGGTFTLTSIGSIGGIFSAPIVNQPEVAIMGIQKIEKRPVVRTVNGEDAIVIRQMTYLSISGDHRVVDGAEVALFMKEVIGWLEEPSRLLLNVR